VGIVLRFTNVRRQLEYRFIKSCLGVPWPYDWNFLVVLTPLVLVPRFNSPTWIETCIAQF